MNNDAVTLDSLPHAIASLSSINSPSGPLILMGDVQSNFALATLKNNQFETLSKGVLTSSQNDPKLSIFMIDNTPIVLQSFISQSTNKINK